MSQPGMISGSGVGSGVELGVDEVVGTLDELDDEVLEPEGTQPASATSAIIADATAPVIRARSRRAIAELSSRPLFMIEE